MQTGHKLYIALLTLIVIAVTASLTWTGYSYYSLPLEERFFHGGHQLLRPSGAWGHGFGIAGSLCMIFGIILYMARKRMRWMARFGHLKHWLEFHIFLCTLGPVLILFHTAFKFGGLVAVSFWSMVAVFASGIIGRFIYIQIPRTIEGRELSLSEVRALQTNIGTVLAEKYKFEGENAQAILESVRKRGRDLSRKERREIVKLVKQELSLNRRIDRLVTMQKLFRYWHVAHLPFALVMLIIMVIHVIVTITFGYRWIF